MTDPYSQVRSNPYVFGGLNGWNNPWNGSNIWNNFQTPGSIWNTGLGFNAGYHNVVNNGTINPIAELAHRLALFGTDHPVEVLKILQFDDTVHDAEELAARPADAPRNHDHPGIADPRHHGATNKGARIVMFSPIDKEITVRRIDRRDRPSQRKIDDLAGIIEQ